MTDTNPGGWPDPAKPGYPLSPERDGWHWLQWKRAEARPVEWLAGGDGIPPCWVKPGRAMAAETVGQDYRYLGPCHTPAEVAALVEAARREEREACAEAARCVPIPEDCCAFEAHGRISAALEACMRIRARGDA